jgi:hypothetical protein
MAGQVRILAIGLLSPAPARIAEDIDIGGPDGQALIAAVILVGADTVELGARLGRDRIADTVEQIGIPGRSQTDGLRENGRLTDPRDAVQALIPPVLAGNAVARNGMRRVL